MILLPFDCINIIFNFLPWSSRTKMVSREWLYIGLRPKRRIRRWKSLMRIYSYMRVFGTGFSNHTWSGFCQQLEIRRRKRNRHGRLSWRATARHHMSTSCKACGKRHCALVYDTIPLCVYCRHNRRLKYAYMVRVCDARAMGVPRHILRRIPYHASWRGRLRFWHRVVQATQLYRQNVLASAQCVDIDTSTESTPRWPH